MVNIVFSKNDGEAKGFGVNVRSDYFSTKTVIGFEGNSTIYVDRSKSGAVTFMDDFQNLKKMDTDYDLTKG